MMDGTMPPVSNLYIEYAWSHECCNQWKSDLKFIKTFYHNGIRQYEINEDNIDNFFKKLVEYQNKTSDSGNPSHNCNQICSQNGYKRPSENSTMSDIKASNCIVQHTRLYYQIKSNNNSIK